MAKRVENYAKLSPALYDCHGPTWYPNPAHDTIVDFLQRSCIPREINDGRTRGTFDWYAPGGVINVSTTWSACRESLRGNIERTVHLEVMPPGLELPQELSDYLTKEKFDKK